MYPKQQVFFVLGLSKSGLAAANFLLAKGAIVFVHDDLTTDRIEKETANLVEKGARRVKKEDVSRIVDACDALVLSPGIPIDHPLAVAFKRKGKAVVGETELAVRFMRCPIVAVTGTNGKTTTVSMISEILKNAGHNAQPCGNIGEPMINFASLNENCIAVAEISSFQLETLNSLRPHVSVVLNVTQDHLNRHYTMENYVFLKTKLLKNSVETEYAVLNYDDTTVRSMAEKTKARVLWFSLREKVNGAYYENGVLYFSGEKILQASEMLTGGLHNIQNALASIAVSKLFGVETTTIRNTLIAFKGIKHRVERIGELDGVTFINDSKGTNVDATIKAAEMMKEETVVLLGGKNKGYDYTPLFTAFKRLKIVHAVLYGENRYALLKSAREQGFQSVSVCEKFTLAVSVARLIAKRGQNILLSPASASFDEFSSYEERGDKFVEIVRSFEETETKPKNENVQTEISDEKSNETFKEGFLDDVE